MVNFYIYMIRDKISGRWHNWGGLTEWYPDTPQGGTWWYEKEKAEKFAAEYPKETGVDAEVVTIHVCAMPK